MDDIYKRKSHWKWYLIGFGLLIVGITMLYTKRITDQLSADEKVKVEQFVMALQSISTMDMDTAYNICDLSLPHSLIIQNHAIPIIMLDENRRIESFRNLEPDNPNDDMDTAIVRQYLNEMMRKDHDSLIVRSPYYSKTIYFSNSPMLEKLKLYPYLQLMLIAGFIAFGYYTFSMARKAEQNLVWVGMAKETAHQLGTPISAIIGWVENLKMLNEEDETNTEMLDELRKDVTRLELVADRFSKIGTTAELEPLNVFEQLEAIERYMKMRSPKRVDYEFPKAADFEPIVIQANAHLLDWVLENIIRNAIDAMETGEGVVSASVSTEGKYVNIDISDTGKGIPNGSFKSIFKPGYSTKKRGWGLGLSLSKRIITESHKGRIFVLGSEPNVQTTFRIQLPM